MKRFFLILSCTVLLGFYSCDLFQEVQKLGNLVNCTFSLKNIEGLTLAGINVQNITSLSSLTLLDVGTLTAAVAGGSLPLSFTLNVNAKNPNASPAGMTKLDWILFIDDIQMTTGSLNKNVTIPAYNGTSVIPITMKMDLKKILTNQTGNALLNFGLNLAGNNNKPTRVSLKAKPTISVGGYLLEYPGYLTIKAN